MWRGWDQFSHHRATEYTEFHGDSFLYLSSQSIQSGLCLLRALNLKKSLCILCALGASVVKKTDSENVSYIK